MQWAQALTKNVKYVIIFFLLELWLETVRKILAMVTAAGIMAPAALRVFENWASVNVKFSNLTNWCATNVNDMQ